MFEVRGKVALITGGVSGIGYECAKALLNKGLKGATLIDVNQALGREVVKEFTTLFGNSRVLFLEVDVRNKEKFEEAFQVTIRTFGNLDIVINNAGILDDKNWEAEIDVNVKGTINGTLLAMEKFLPRYKSGEQGFIFNMSSVSALQVEPSIPIYIATKAAILALSRSLGAMQHYETNKVKVITLCIGGTITSIANEIYLKLLFPQCSDLLLEHIERYTLQMPESVGTCLLKVANEAKSGSVWIIEDGKAYEIEFESRIGRHKL